MLYSINTETVNTHIYIIYIAVLEIVVYLRIFSFKIKAVISNGLILCSVFIPVTASAETKAQARGTFF